MIDTHCHLDLPIFDADRAEVLARAAAAGVRAVMIPAIRPSTFSGLPALVARHSFPQLWLAIGTHPQVVPELDADERAMATDPEAIADSARRLGARAIGECGLDGATGDPQGQEQVFRAHIRAARLTGLPLIIHLLRAHDSAPRILDEERARDVGGVLHSYSGGAALVPVYRALDLHFSFAGPVSYSNARRPLEAARLVPLDRLLVETDAPDQTPEPYRGQRCEPAYLVQVVDALARAHGIPPAELAARTAHNAAALFPPPGLTRPGAALDSRNPDSRYATLPPMSSLPAASPPAALPIATDPPRTHRRFDRAARLLGDEGLQRLGSATATVIGLGGVGSFAAEALCRSGVGRLILIDFDRVCVTNTNRQLHAMKGTLGKNKVDVMAERLRAINPDAVIETRREFYSEKNAARLLVPEPDIVVDAIDNVSAKLHLIATCIRQRIRLVSSMGAAARVDPTRVRVTDLAFTRVDPFARHLRKDLRRKWGIDCSRALGVLAVYSEEPPLAPRTLAYDSAGYVCVCPGGHNGMHDCDHGSRVDGSLPFVPATFGLTLAATAVRLLCPDVVGPAGAVAAGPRSRPERDAPSDTVG